MKTYSNTKPGFTLIELLVVMAIVSLLAAILFPVFAQAREKARQTTCLSNLRQLGLAFEQYCGDYDELFPGAYDGNTATFKWAGVVYAYVKSTAVYTCPDDTSIFSPHISYIYNSNTSVDLISFAVASVKTLGNMTSPSKTVVLAEATPSSAADPSNPDVNLFDLWGDCDYGTHGSFATGPMDDCAFATLPNRHPQGAMYLAADGHVKYLRPEKVSGGKDSNGGSDPATASICLGNSNSPQDTVNRCAEGTQFAGPDAHTLTYSTQ